MKKIGLLVLALVLALGGLGAAYASWTDQVTIDGTVETGTVDVVVEYVSWIEVWKDLDTDETVTVAYAADEIGAIVFGPYPASPPANGLLVAYTTAAIDNQELDEVSFTFNNLYPCDVFVIDVKLHCVGSVPVKLNAVSLVSDAAGDWVADLIGGGDIGYEMFRYTPGATPADMGTIGEPYTLGGQLEDCDWIIIFIGVHIPQMDIYQGLTGADAGSMTMTVDFIQWNNYVGP